MPQNIVVLTLILAAVVVGGGLGAWRGLEEGAAAAAAAAAASASPSLTPTRVATTDNPTDIVTDTSTARTNTGLLDDLLELLLGSSGSAAAAAHDSTAEYSTEHSYVVVVPEGRVAEGTSFSVTIEARDTNGQRYNLSADGGVYAISAIQTTMGELSQSRSDVAYEHWAPFLFGPKSQSLGVGGSSVTVTFDAPANAGGTLISILGPNGENVPGTPFFVYPSLPHPTTAFTQLVRVSLAAVMCGSVPLGLWGARLLDPSTIYSFVLSMGVGMWFALKMPALHWVACVAAAPFGLVALTGPDLVGTLNEVFPGWSGVFPKLGRLRLLPPRTTSASTTTAKVKSGSNGGVGGGGDVDGARGDVDGGDSDSESDYGSHGVGEGMGELLDDRGTGSVGERVGSAHGSGLVVESGSGLVERRAGTARRRHVGTVGAGGGSADGQFVTRGHGDDDDGNNNDIVSEVDAVGFSVDSRSSRASQPAPAEPASTEKTMYEKSAAVESDSTDASAAADSPAQRQRGSERVGGHGAAQMEKSGRTKGPSVLRRLDDGAEVVETWLGELESAVQTTYWPLLLQYWAVVGTYLSERPVLGNTLCYFSATILFGYELMTLVYGRFVVTLAGSLVAALLMKTNYMVMARARRAVLAFESLDLSYIWGCGVAYLVHALPFPLSTFAASLIAHFVFFHPTNGGYMIVALVVVTQVTHIAVVYWWVPAGLVAWVYHHRVRLGKSWEDSFQAMLAEDLNTAGSSFVRFIDCLVSDASYSWIDDMMMRRPPTGLTAVTRARVFFGVCSFMMYVVNVTWGNYLVIDVITGIDIFYSLVYRQRYAKSEVYGLLFCLGLYPVIPSGDMGIPMSMFYRAVLLGFLGMAFSMLSHVAILYLWPTTVVKAKMLGFAPNAADTLDIEAMRDDILPGTFDLLDDCTAEELVLKPRVTFVGAGGVEEPGDDYGGLTCEWIRLVAEALASGEHPHFAAAHQGGCYNINAAALYGPTAETDDYRLIGRFLAIALLNSVPTGLSLAPSIFKVVLGRGSVTFGDLAAYDEAMYSQLANFDPDAAAAHLVLTFSVDLRTPRVTIPLIEGGEDIEVTRQNVAEYRNAYAKFHLQTHVEGQLAALTEGFTEVMETSLFTRFSPEELATIIAGSSAIDVEDWKGCTIYCQRLNPTRRRVLWFWEIVGAMTNAEREALFRAVTGSARLPVGGFQHLQPRFKLACSRRSRDEDQSREDHAAIENARIPTASTCFNTLQLPGYNSKEVLRTKLMQFTRLGQYQFGYA